MSDVGRYGARSPGRPVRRAARPTYPSPPRAARPGTPLDPRLDLTAPAAAEDALPMTTGSMSSKGRVAWIPVLPRHLQHASRIRHPPSLLSDGLAGGDSST